MADLTGMITFARVAELESFSAAARELKLSKSAVSKQISRLEDRLGLRLLNRTTRRLSLTEAGLTFYQGCRQVARAAEAAEQAVNRLAEAPRGSLRVNAPMSFGMRHVAPALSDLLARYPEMSIDLDLNDRIVDLVDEGYDVAIRIGRLEDSSLIARRLAPSRRLLCAAPGYLEVHGRPRHPQDLSEHNCLLYSYQNQGSQWRFRGADGVKQVKVEGRLRANNGEVLLEAALAGFGLTFMPTFLCGDAVRRGRLVSLLPAWRDSEEAAVHAVFPTSRNLVPKVRVFVDYLARRFGEAPYWDEALP